VLRLMILVAAITATGIALLQWASRLRVLGAQAEQISAQHWQAMLGNTIVAAVLWYVWFSI
jgi:hypothetical protein